MPAFANRRQYCLKPVCCSGKEIGQLLNALFNACKASQPLRNAGVRLKIPAGLEQFVTALQQFDRCGKLICFKGSLKKRSGIRFKVFGKRLAVLPNAQIFVVRRVPAHPESRFQQVQKTGRPDPSFIARRVLWQRANRVVPL